MWELTSPHWSRRVGIQAEQHFTSTLMNMLQKEQEYTGINRTVRFLQEILCFHSIELEAFKCAFYLNNVGIIES